MPINIYRREADNTTGNSISALAQGFIQGQEMKKKKQTDALNQLLLGAKIQELQRKTAGLSAPANEGYVRDAYSGKSLPDKNYVSPAQKQMMNMFGSGNPQNSSPAPTTSGPGPLGVPPANDYEPNFKFDSKGNTSVTYKPRKLGGDAASKYQAGIQGNENAQDLINAFGFQQGEDGSVTAPNFMRKKMKLAAANIKLNGPLGVPGVSKAVEGLGQLFAGDEGKDLDLALTTLAKNVYRSETGAAGNAGEIENVKRRLVTRMTDSQKIALKRILSSEGFVRGVAENIKPGTTRPPVIPKSGGQLMTDASGNQAFVYPDGTYKEL